MGEKGIADHLLTDYTATQWFSVGGAECVPWQEMGEGGVGE